MKNGVEERTTGLEECLKAVTTGWWCYPVLEKTPFYSYFDSLLLKSSVMHCNKHIVRSAMGMQTYVHKFQGKFSRA